MAPSYNGGAPEKETDPEKQTTAYKVAKGLVIILSALIVLGLLALVAGIAMNLSGKSSAGKQVKAQTPGVAAVPAGNPTLYQLPPGSRIVDMDSQPGRLIVRVEGPRGEAIDIFDTQDGRLVGQVKAGRGGD